MPATLSVYNGTDDEPTDFPDTGKVLGSQDVSQTVPAHSFAVAPITIATPLDTGAYLVALRSAVGGGHPDLTWENYFVMPPKMDKPNPLFGLDASQLKFAKTNRRLGVGWVRYETISWPMVSPKKDYYAFDGSVKPW